MKGVLLPRLNEIIVENYTLYKLEPTFKYVFKEGINAVVGVNGVGKTTFVNMIIYCLVGHRKRYNVNKKNSKKSGFEFYDTEYFSSRMNLEAAPDINKSATVSLSFSIGQKEFYIKRSLQENVIVQFKEGTEVVPGINEELYEEIIQAATHIRDFKDFEFIIREFLFFDEGRRNVAWETVSQDNILRILLLDDEIHEKLKYLEEKITEQDTRGRHKSEDRRMATKAYEDLVNEKNKLELEKNEATNEENTYEKLVLKRNTLDELITNYQTELASTRDKLEKMIYQFNTLEGEITNTSAQLDVISNNIKKYESIIYKSLYEKFPDYYYTIEKNMLHEGKCLVCNNKSELIKSNAQQYRKNNQCLICHSNVEIYNELTEEDITTYNELTEQFETLQNIIKNKNELKNNLGVKLSNMEDKINSLENSLNNAKMNLILVKDELDNKRTDSNGDTYTEILHNKENLIQQLDKEIREAYQQRDEFKSEHLKYSNLRKGMISSLNQSLSTYFNKYASTFIGLSCELSVTERTYKKLPHIIYIPKINNILRKDINAVSESQRFFLDQAFRMAIIDFLQSNVEGFRSFFITETPEGSLDFAYESQVANMFIKFANSNNQIIFTSNLNNSTFMHDLFKLVPSEQRKSRILNLLEKGNITKVQLEKLDLLNKIINSIMEG